MSLINIDGMFAEELLNKKLACESPVCLKVAAFSKYPTLDFRDAKVGDNKTLCLNILNPNDFDTSISIVPLPKDCDFEISSIIEENESIVLQPNTSFVLDIKWMPSKPGNTRQVLKFKWDGGLLLQAILVGRVQDDLRRSIKTSKKKIVTNNGGTNGCNGSLQNRLKSDVSPVKRKVLVPIQPDTPSRRTTFLISKPTIVYNSTDKENTDVIPKPSCSPLSFQKQTTVRRSVTSNVVKPDLLKTDKSLNILDELVNGQNGERRKTFNIQNKESTKRNLFKTKSSNEHLAMPDDKPKETKYLKRKSVSQTLPKHSMAAGIAIKKLCLKTSKTSMPRHPMPFAAKNMFYDERWIDKQERGFTNWINFILTPPDDEENIGSTNQSTDRRETFTIDAGKRQPVAPTKEDLSLRVYSMRRRMARLRRSACLLYQSEEFMHCIHQIEKEIECGLIAVRPEKRIEADLGIKNKILQMFLSYNSLWLRIGLEVIFGELIPLHSNKDISNLSKFIHQRLLANPDIARQYSHSTVPNLYKPGYDAALSKFTTKKFVLVVVFLDYAKEKRLIDHDPCLFNKEAEFKASRDLLIAFSRDYLKGEGDFTKHLGYLGVTVKHSQTALDEYDYGVKNIAVDLRDGVRLVRVVELLTQQWILSLKVRLPAVSRLQKVHNVGLALSFLAHQGLDITQDAKCIVDGHREKTLLILWQIIFHFQVGILLDIEKLKEEVMYLKKRLRLHSQMLLPMNSIDEKFLGIDRRESLDKEIYFKSDKLSLLLNWSKIICAHYDVKIENFTVSFSDGIAFCCIVNFYHPDILPKSLINHETTSTCNIAHQEDGEEDDFFYDGWTKCFSPNTGVNRRLETLLNNEKENFRILNEAVQELGGIPSMLRVNDMSNTIPDEKVVITYVSYLCARLLNIREETQAARKIQLAWKNYCLHKRREFYLVEDRAATKIQACFRGFLGHMDYLVYRECVILCQSVARRWLTMNQLKRQAEAARKIQAAYTGYVRLCRERYEFLQMRSAAILIQRAYRHYLQHEYLKQDIAAAKIQSTWKSYVQYHIFFNMKVCAIFIQSVIRMNLQRSRYLKQKKAVLVIQSCFRAQLQMKKHREQYLFLQKFVLLLQRRWRSKRMAQFHRNAYLTKVAAAKKIQAWHRMLRMQKMYKRKKESVIKIKSWYRSCYLMRRDRMHYLRLRLAVLLLQATIRRWLVKKNLLKMQQAAILIQSCWKGKKEMDKHFFEYEQLRKSSIVIQSFWRMRNARSNFLKKKESVRKIQTFYRSMRSMRHCSAYFCTLKKSTIVLQSCVRMYLCKVKSRKRQSAAHTIQNHWKGYQLMKKQVGWFSELKRKTILLQSYVRGNLARKVYIKNRCSIITIQSFLRMRKARLEYLKKRQSVVLLQKLARKHLCERSYLKKKAAVVCIQSVVRMWKVKKDMHKRSCAAVKIQSHYRAFTVHRSYLEKRNACITVQAFSRMCLQRRRYLETMRACIFFQALWKSVVARREYRHKYQVILLLQSYCRMKKERRNFQKKVKAIISIQSAARMFFTRKRLLEKKLAVVRIQSFYRMLLVNRLYVQKRNSAIKIQATYKAYKERKNYVLAVLSVVKVQAFFRMVANKKRYVEQKGSAVIIQSFIKMVNTRTTFLRKKDAVLKIKYAYKTYCERRKFCILKDSALKIQSIWRMHVAQRAYAQTKTAVTILQSMVRSKQAMLCCVKETAAAVKIQSMVRMWIVQNVAKKEWLAATKIQCFVRMYLTFSRYQKFKWMVVRIQSHWRMRRDRIAFTKMKVASVIAQAAIRKYLSRKIYLKKRKAAVLIQSSYRMHLEQRRYVRIKKEVLLIQSCYRMYVKVREFRRKKEALCTMQSFFRSYLERKRFLKIKDSALKIQSVYRMYLHQKQFLETKNAVVLIQKYYRTRLTQKRMTERNNAVLSIQYCYREYVRRRTLAQMTHAATQLQSVWRMYKQRSLFVSQKEAALRIQSVYRGCAVRKDLLRRQAAVKQIESFWSTYKCRSQFIKKRNSAVHIQSIFRMFSVRNAYSRKKASALAIQSYYRMSKQCRLFHSVKNAVTKIQTWHRGIVCRKKYLKKKKAAVVIQRRFRGFLLGYACYVNYHVTRGAIMTIQSNYKMFVQRRKYDSMKKAVTLLQAAVRMYHCKSYYDKRKKAAVMIQSAWRAHQSKCLLFKKVFDASVQLQAFFKMAKQRTWYIKQKEAVIKLQAFTRMSQERRRYLSINNACITLQIWWKRLRLLQLKRSQEEAATVIQSAYRRHVAQSTFLQKKKSSIKLQSVVRMFLVRFSLHRQYKAALKIQNWCRMVLQRQTFVKHKNAAIIIQQRYRAFVICQATYFQFHLMRGAAITIQASIRGYLVRKEVRLRNSSVVIIQSFIRMYIHRARYVKIKQSCILLQAYIRRNIAVKDYTNKRQAAIRIQSYIRGLLAQKQLKDLQLRHIAAIRIQCAFRTFYAKMVYRRLCLERDQHRLLEAKVRSAKAIQLTWRVFVVRKRFLATIKAACRVQAFVRCYQQEQRYRKQRKSALVIQRWTRCFQARYRQRQEYLVQKEKCLVIQRMWRGYDARKKYKKDLLAIANFQRRFKCLLQTRKLRHEFLLKRSACHVIQKAFRRYPIMKKRRLHAAALKIGSFFQMIQVRKHYLNVYKATLCIQHFWTSHQQHKQTVMLLKAAVLIQRWYRSCYTTRLSRLQLARFKQSVVIIQRCFRKRLENKRILSILKLFLSQHNAAVKIQHVYRGYANMRKTREIYLLKKTATLTVQRQIRIFLHRRWESKRNMAACVLQRWFKKCKRRIENELLESRHTLIIGFAKAAQLCLSVLRIQRWRRAILQKRREFHQRRKNNAVIKIQSLRRGFVVRRMIKDKRVKEIRKRIEVANNNVTEPMKLCNRTKSALDYLLHVKNLSTVHDALQHLDVVTTLSFRCCEKLVADNALPVIFQIIKHGNRSLPWISIKQVAFSILLNVAKCPTTYTAVYKEEHSMNIILEQMTNFRDKKAFIFPMACNLLSVFCNDELLRKDIKNKPAILEKIAAFYRMAQRKQKLDQQRNIKKEKEQHFSKTAWSRRASCINSRDPYTAIELLSKKLHIKTDIR